MYTCKQFVMDIAKKKKNQNVRYVSLSGFGGWVVARV